MNRIKIDVIRSFGGRFMGMVFVDGHLVAKQRFDTYNEAYSWACQEQSAREREVKER